MCLRCFMFLKNGWELFVNYAKVYSHITVNSNGVYRQKIAVYCRTLFSLDFAAHQNNASQIPNMLHDSCRAVPWNIYLKYIFHKNVEAIPNKQKLSMLALTLMEIRRLKIVHVVQRRHKYSGHVTQFQETTKHKVFSKIYDVQDIVHTINTLI